MNQPVAPSAAAVGIDISQSPNWNANRERFQKPNADPCIVCGKACAKPRYFVRLFWGATAVTQVEAEQIIAREGEGGDLLYYPVGSDCLRQHPELKPYVEDAARAMAVSL